MGCGGDCHKPVAARLKGLAEHGQGEVFCIHFPKLNPGIQCCQPKDDIMLRPCTARFSRLARLLSRHETLSR
jgi:hypothetical protein